MSRNPSCIPSTPSHHHGISQGSPLPRALFVGKVFLPTSAGIFTTCPNLFPSSPTTNTLKPS